MVYQRAGVLKQIERTGMRELIAKTEWDEKERGRRRTPAFFRLGNPITPKCLTRTLTISVERDHQAHPTCMVHNHTQNQLTTTQITRNIRVIGIPSLITLENHFPVSITKTLLFVNFPTEADAFT